MRPVFVCFSGLPGVGKSTIAEALARQIGALWLRVDLIEQTMRGSEHCPEDLGGLGYHALAGAADAALQQGFDVIADSVNPIAKSRAIYHAMTARGGHVHLDIVLTCSDAAAHRARVEGRASMVPGLKLPDWATVMARPWEALEGAHLTVDTARQTPVQSAAQIAAVMEEARG